MTEQEKQLYAAFERTPNPNVAEKDYLECAILCELFQNPKFINLFRLAGSASISKAYTISQRIGQDIDLTYTNADEFMPSNKGRGLRTAKKKFRKFIFEDISNDTNTILKKSKTNLLFKDFDIQPDTVFCTKAETPCPTLHLGYKSEYTAQDVSLSLEFAPRQYSDASTEYRSVIPYSTRTPIGNIPTVRYEQTFWDKIYALHSIAEAGPGAHFNGTSRHYYDVIAIMPFVNLNDTKHMLKTIEEYQQINTTKHIQKITNFSEIELLPSAEILDNLEQDYTKMKKSYLSPSCDWSTLVKHLINLNKQIKTL